MNREDYPNPQDQFAALLAQVAAENDVDVGLIYNLLEYEKEKVHLERRRGAKDQIRKQIEDWLKSD